MSLPSRERGLKLSDMVSVPLKLPVAPFAGAWIETVKDFVNACGLSSRSLRGSVD